MTGAIVLLSGGLDSTTCLFVARRDGFAPLHALSFRYGQRHGLETERAALQARAAGAKEHRVIDIDLRSFGGSALTSDIDVPKNRGPAIGAGIPVTYVPARNTLFLSYALAWAEVLGVGDLFIGVNALDFSGYPDCRPEFVRAFESAANLGTRMGAEGGGVPVHAPLQYMKKVEIVELAASLGVDLGRTISCYDPSPLGVSCGRCDSCALRLRAFEEAGMADPIEYARP